MTNEAVPPQSRSAKDTSSSKRSRRRPRRPKNRAPVSRPEDIIARQARIDGFTLDYPESLPISEHADEIARLVQQHPVVVVAGETGSGKTTQLPKICLAAGRGRQGMIAHTQPRRLAARAVANRLAEEVGTEVGQGVGVAVRFLDQVATDSVVKLMTDGLLLGEVRSDPQWRRYDTVIIDEAHERSLNIDFLLGLLKRALAERDDLRVVVTSATIDVQRFAEYFGGAPVVEVSGRGYPVDIRYLPQDPEQNRDASAELLEAVEQALSLPVGAARDVLIFQTGEREILESARVLRQAYGERLDILPLYARLSHADQQRVFRVGQRRRLILATNVAETSLTVPNIGFVIDPGLARINRYSYRTKLARLPIEPISQASANQRAGRCGRVAPGVCLRLYDATDFASRPDFTDPEIKRVNLASVLLQMMTLRLGAAERFGFIEPPEPRALKDAERLLHELGAVAGHRLTEVGRVMARLPVDPRLARMLIESRKENALSELLILVSGLTVQDPRERPLDKQGAADAKHERFVDERSDFLSLLKVWGWAHNVREQVSNSRADKIYREHFVSPRRMREWRDLFRQLSSIVRELGWRVNQLEATAEQIHRCVLAGSLSQVGMHDEKGRFSGARNSQFRIFPGSALAARTPRWLVATEIVETSRVYARTVAPVDPRWIEPLASHLVRRQVAEPHWSVKRGAAMAYERVTLYGLPVVERRLVRLSGQDMEAARELFLREGVLASGFSPSLLQQLPFLGANQATIASVLELEAKSRRRDLMIDEAELLEYFARHLPTEAFDGRSLLRWWKKAEPAERKSLYLSREQLLRDQPTLAAEDYPADLSIGGMVLPLRYRFAPGTPEDGVNLQVTPGVVNSLSDEALEWLVPGLLPLLVEHLLRALPKQLRRALAPIADKVDPLTALLSHPRRYRVGRLLSAMADALAGQYAIKVTAADWRASELPAHLRMNIQVIDERGKVAQQSRDLKSLRVRYREALRESVASADDFQQFKLDGFPNTGVAQQHRFGSAGSEVIAYPALRDARDFVDLVLVESPAQAQRLNRDGYARAALLGLAKSTRGLRQELKQATRLGLLFARLGELEQLEDEMLRSAAWACFFEDQAAVTTQPEFDARLAAKRAHFAGCFRERLTLVEEILQGRPARQQLRRGALARLQSRGG